MNRKFPAYGLILIIACCLCLQTNAQIDDTLNKDEWQKQIKKDKKNFKDLFLQGLKSNSRSKKKKEAFIAPPGHENIPKELFKIREGQSHNSSVVLGISDPFMDTPQGLKLAKHRAKSIFAILDESTISYVTDFYVNEKGRAETNQIRSTLEEFGMVNSKEMNDFKINVLDIYRTRYDETIVVTSKKSISAKNQSNNLDSLRFTGKFYRASNRVGQNYGYRYLIDYNAFSDVYSDSLGGEEKETNYLLHNIGNHLKVKTQNLDTSWHLDSMFLNYRMDTIFVPENLPSYSLKKGLWAGYISALMGNIFFETGISRSTIKNVTETYQYNMQDLKRNIYQNRYSFRVNNMCVIDNELYIELESREIVKKSIE